MRSMIISVIIISLAASGNAEELIKPGETLRLEQAVEIALKHHPSILAAENSVEAGRSRIGQARSGYYPHIELSGSYTKYDPVPGTFALPPGTGRPPFDRYSATASLNQTIFDFGKTANSVSVQKYGLDALHADLRATENDVVFNVKQAYFGVARAERNRKVAEETVKLFEQHLSRAEGFFKAGVSSRFDVTKARVDLSNARLGLIRAENALKVAIVNLNNAMGMPNAPVYSVEDILPYKKYEITFEDALERAYRNRPDLIALIARKEASDRSVSLARKGFFPTLSGSASYNWAGEEFPLGNGWSATVTLTFPLFSGFLTYHQVGEAKANLNILSANEEALKQSILLEVRQAHLNLLEAEERIAAAELTVQQAKENMEIANGRYQAGVGSPIEVADAEVSYSSAQQDYIQALYDYRIAQASLERAMGER